MLLLIVGITGNLGQRLALAALNQKCQVRGFGRNPSKLDVTIQSKLESFVRCNSYDDISAIDKAVKGADAILCGYSTDPLLYLDGCLLFLRAAERASVKIFVAPSWTSDWTAIRYGDFEIYNSIIAFANQAAITSSIRPVYIINGAFAEYQLIPEKDTVDAGKMDVTLQYWGDVNNRRLPWTTMDDAAAWTVELITRHEQILKGQGGTFKIRSGYNSLEELANIYQRVTGAKVKLLRKGDAHNLEAELACARRTEEHKSPFEYLYLAWNALAIRGAWDFPVSRDVAFERRPSTFEDHIRGRLAGQTHFSLS